MKPAQALAVLARRAAAFLIDMTLLAVLLAAVWQFSGESAKLALLALSVVGWFLYFPVVEALSGATLGKRLMQLRVVKLDGSPCGWRAAIIRNLLRPADTMPFGSNIVGLLLILVTPQKQRLGDIAAGTLVVPVKRGKPNS